MNGDILISDRDTMLVVIPLIVVVLAHGFHLVHIVAAPKKPPGHQRLSWGDNELGEPILRDPDGRLSESRPSKGSRH